MMNKRIFLSIMLIFLILFVLFMFSALSSDMLSSTGTNTRDEEPSAITGETVMLESSFDMDSGESAAAETSVSETAEEASASAASEEAEAADTQTRSRAVVNPYAVLIGKENDGLPVLKEWCVYNKYRYRAYTEWPDVSALDTAAVVLVGEMDYDAAALATLQAYAQTGIPLLFTCLPDYETLAASPELADFFGILQCVSPARQVDGLKLFADFFISEERIYNEGDFYGQEDDTQFTLPYYTLRTGYEGYLVGLMNDQDALGIENEELPTLLWRTYTGNSEIYVVNTDLFDGERMLGVLTAFVSEANAWYLYPVVNARAIMMTDYPFLSDENSDTMQIRYSRDTLGFERDIVWPNVVKVFNNYEAVPNFFLSLGLDYTENYQPLSDDLTLYRKLIKGLSGTIGLSLMQTSGLSLDEVADKVTAFFDAELPEFSLYAAYGGTFTDEDWETYLASGGAGGVLSDISLVLTPYSEGRSLFAFLSDQVLSVRMTTDGFTHETMDDLQLISLMTALGYCSQQVDMDRALFPAGDADDWSNLSMLWSMGDTYYRDYAAFENTSVYGLEERVRRLLASNFDCERTGDTLNVHVEPFYEQMWFVLRLHGEEVTGVAGGEATAISDTAYLIRADQADVSITVTQTHYVNPPNGKEGNPS